MPLLQNSDWKNARLDQRIITKSTKVCSIGEIRETDPVPLKDHAGITETQVLVPLALEEAAATVDGETVPPGFPVMYRIRNYESSNGPLPTQPKDLAKAQELSLARVKALVAAALGHKRNTKEDLAALLAGAGGWASLNGKKVVVAFDVTESKGTKYQEISSVSSLPQQA